MPLGSGHLHGIVLLGACLAAVALGSAAAEDREFAGPRQPPVLWSSITPLGVRTTNRAVRPANWVPSGYNLVWQDDFKKQFVIDTDASRWSSYFRKWNIRYLPGNGDQGIKVHDDMIVASGRRAADALRSDGRWGDRQQFLHEVSNGTLKLRAYPLSQEMRSEFWGFPYVASMISADRSPGTAYGYWEIRARINAIGKGQHLAFWLLPDDATWPPEVDMLEVVGTKPGQFTANIHLPDGEAAPSMTFYPEPASADGFHTIGFQWTPTTMRWTVDGRIVREHENSVTSKEFYILVSWEIGSYWPGDPDATTPWPAEAEIDYVRFYGPAQ